MSLKNQIRFRKMILALCGLIFGGVALSDSPNASPQFVNRIKKAQNDIFAKGTKAPTASEADRLLAQSWSNLVDPYGWVNAWANGGGNPSWSNTTGPAGWGNAWSNLT